MGRKFQSAKIRVYGAFCESMDEPDTPSCHTSGPHGSSSDYLTVLTESGWLQDSQLPKMKKWVRHMSPP